MKIKEIKFIKNQKLQKKNNNVKIVNKYKKYLEEILI